MKKALLIGINYQSIPSISLNGCINDTINIRNVLIDAYGYNPSNIVMLRDDSSSNQPTRYNIMQQLQLITAQSSNLEEIIIHYSGHGSLINQNGNDTESTGMDQIIIPVDYQTRGIIRDNDLLAIIKNIKCRAILLFDSCHSGTVCDLPWSFQCTTNTTYSRIQNNNVVITNPNIFMMSGCKDMETSVDISSAFLRKSVGAFTNAFIECLRNNQHNMSIMLLYRDICTNLMNAGFSQVPLLSSSCMNPSYVITRSTITNSKNANPQYTIANVMKSILYKK